MDKIPEDVRPFTLEMVSPKAQTHEMLLRLIQENEQEDLKILKFSISLFQVVETDCIVLNQSTKYLYDNGYLVDGYLVVVPFVRSMVQKLPSAKSTRFVKNLRAEIPGEHASTVGEMKLAFNTRVRAESVVVRADHIEYIMKKIAQHFKGNHTPLFNLLYYAKVRIIQAIGSNSPELALSLMANVKEMVEGGRGGHMVRQDVSRFENDECGNSGDQVKVPRVVRVVRVVIGVRVND